MSKEQGEKMIDTIGLYLDRGEYEITDYDKFSPTAKNLFEEPYYTHTKGKVFTCVQNPTKADMKAGIYKPSLKIMRIYDGYGLNLRLYIEFSIPKLLYGNNFEELRDEHIELVPYKLNEVLQSMGVLTSEDNLSEANVSKIHYSKNILFTVGKVSELINKIKKLGISQKMDIGGTDFHNGGNAVRIHTNTYEFAFYDKVKELQQAKFSEKRVQENDNSIQFNCLNALKNTEILRVEVRLNKTQEIKRVLENCNGWNEETTFESLCDRSIARYVLLSFWFKYITPTFANILATELGIDEIFSQLQSIGFKEGQIFEIIGVLAYIKENGLRMLKQNSSANYYYRIKKILDNIKIDELYSYKQLKAIENDIDDMISLIFD